MNSPSYSVLTSIQTFTNMTLFGIPPTKKSENFKTQVGEKQIIADTKMTVVYF